MTSTYSVGISSLNVFMNSQHIVIAVVVLAVVALLGWYLMSGSPAASDTENDTAAEETANAQNPTSIRAALAKGGNYTCSIETQSETGRTTGTIYGSAGKTRLDLKTQRSDGATVTVHIIRNVGTAYTWVDGQTVGSKTSITPTSAVVPQPTGGVISVTDDSSISSDCHAWLPDQGQFTPPKEITFTAP